MYDDNGKTYTKKVMSFANPGVFATLRDAKNGDVFNITTVKNEKTGYWDWTSAQVADGAAEPAGAAAKPFAARTGSTYETPEERAIKQRLIVRQSSLAQSIAYDKEAGPEDLLRRAEEFAEWVYQAPIKLDASEDLPF